MTNMNGMLTRPHGGTLTLPMLAVLTHGFGYDVPAMRNTRWYGTGRWLPAGVDAITLGNRVYFTPGSLESLSPREWFGLIIHEMTHRQQIRTDTLAGFYGSYLLQSVTGYSRISYEKEAYYAHSQAIGGNRRGQRAQGTCLWEYRLAGAMQNLAVGDLLLDSTLSEAQKISALTQLCRSWRIEQLSAHLQATQNTGLTGRRLHKTERLKARLQAKLVALRQSYDRDYN
ncbi:MAG: hypothetical protein KF690_05430 [Bacteroidetes bacterium]|nr:hypothetical protein [Bacteroidota bacterium]